MQNRFMKKGKAVMKKSRVFALGLLSVLCAGALNAQAADTGTITFNGNIVDNTCTVSVNGQDTDGTVTLPDVMAATLKEAGSTAGKTDFKLEVSGCTGVEGSSTVAAEFSAMNVDVVVLGTDMNNKDAGGYGEMMNIATNGAEHVSLQLMGNDSETIGVESTDASIANDSNYVNISDDGTATIPLSVQYHSAGDATSGPVASGAVYQLLYK
ncbi:MAG TPA: fimbrial protein [Buttiauxella sp.]|jgi:major type 1 subunit fimbrin (pilin)